MFIKMKCFENNDRTGKFRNHIFEEARYTDEESRSENPYAQFLSLSDTDLKNFMKPTKKAKASPKKKAKKKKKARQTLEDILE